VITRVWECGIAPATADELVHWIGLNSWPKVTVVPGFMGGSLYTPMASNDRIVTVTHWADAEAIAAYVGSDCLGTVRYKGKALTDEDGWLELFLSGYRRDAWLPDSALAELPVFPAVRALAMVGWLDGHGVRAAKYRQVIIDDAVLRCRGLLADQR
jgi:hypothetical protein